MGKARGSRFLCAPRGSAFSLDFPVAGDCHSICGWLVELRGRRPLARFAALPFTWRSERVTTKSGDVRHASC